MGSSSPTCNRAGRPRRCCNRVMSCNPSTALRSAASLVSGRSRRAALPVRPSRSPVFGAARRSTPRSHQWTQVPSRRCRRADGPGFVGRDVAGVGTEVVAVTPAWRCGSRRAAGRRRDRRDWTVVRLPLPASSRAASVPQARLSAAVDHPARTPSSRYRAGDALMRAAVRRITASFELTARSACAR